MAASRNRELSRKSLCSKVVFSAMNIRGVGELGVCNSMSCNRENPIGTASVNSVGSDLECTSRIYFDYVALTLHNVPLTSRKPCQYNNKCDCSKTNGHKNFNEVYVVVFSIWKIHKLHSFCLLKFSGSKKWILIGLNPHATEQNSG